MKLIASFHPVRVMILKPKIPPWPGTTPEVSIPVRGNDFKTGLIFACDDADEE
jgi:hypothetical protein